jgi:hypothetical protein
MDLSWTDDVPIVYPPYTCAKGKRPVCLTLMGVHVRGQTALKNPRSCLLTCDFLLDNGAR